MRNFISLNQTLPGILRFYCACMYMYLVFDHFQYGDSVQISKRFEHSLSTNAIFTSLKQAVPWHYENWMEVWRDYLPYLR